MCIIIQRHFFVILIINVLYLMIQIIIVSVIAITHLWHALTMSSPRHTVPVIRTQRIGLNGERVGVVESARHAGEGRLEHGAARGELQLLQALVVFVHASGAVARAVIE